MLPDRIWPGKRFSKGTWPKVLRVLRHASGGLELDKTQREGDQQQRQRKGDIRHAYRRGLGRTVALLSR